MKCPKCGSIDIDLCQVCKHGLKRCKSCGFVAEQKYFEGEPLPSERANKYVDEKAFKDGLIEAGLNGP